MSDDDDWVGEPPEGRHTRDQADPGYWAQAVAGRRDHRRRSILLLLLVVVLILRAGVARLGVLRRSRR